MPGYQQDDRRTDSRTTGSSNALPRARSAIERTGGTVTAMWGGPFGGGQRLDRELTLA